MSPAPLFRDEVLVERQPQWLGTVLLASRLSHRLFALFAVLTTGAVMALLFFGHYTRKARITGWLVPDQGLVQVFTPVPGVVTEIHVAEGSQVRRGDRLFVLSAELESSSMGATQTEVSRHLHQRRESLAVELGEVERLGAQQLRSLAARIAALDAELEQLGRELVLETARLEMKRAEERRQRALQQGGVITDQQLQATREHTLEEEARLRALERQQMTTRRERLTLRGQLGDLPLITRAQVGNLERNMASLAQELAQAEARREVVISAPTDGTVTAIQVERGGRSSATPLLSIMPAGARLQAHLFSPSRAVGFLRPGQRVLLRYQAYPYQKFGHQEGTVTTISRTALNPGELPPRLSGLTSLVGAGEPVYTITAGLARQTITTYGRQLPLQSGLQLEADVLIESRRLVEWMLDPLYTITGTWNR